MSSRSPRRPVVACLAGLAVALSTLAGVSPAQADVTSSITPPYSQDWSNAGLITANDNWSGVPGVQGYLGTDLVAGPGADPQTVTADGSAVTDVIANGASTSTSGGVLEAATEQTIALQGSGTADVPHVVFRLDLTGQTGATFSFDAKDIDGTVDNSIQQIAVQYRVGATGAYTNLPAGYIADATTGPSLATLVTHKDVPLPAGTDGQADVFVRVTTADAPSSDEWVGIDNISITAGGEPAPLTATDPADVEAIVGVPISDINLQASGGATPYSWDISGLPAGLSETSDGVIGGTPTAAGSSVVTATVTDSATPTPDTDSVQFNINVTEPAELTIAEIQGDGAASDLVGDPVITEGVVTAAYPSGGFFGFYLQTEGTGGSVDPATRTTSDGIFVRQTFDAGPVTVEPGDFVQVFGTVTEFAGQTQVEVTDAADIEPAAGTPDPVTPVTTTSWPATDAQKEAIEGMLYSPDGDFTITNNFATNSFGELGLAVGDSPLIQPTQVARPNTPEADAVEADNAARAIILDDGSSTNFIQTGNAAACAPRAAGCLLNGNLTPPYISNDTPYRVEAVGTFDDDVIFTQGGSPSAPTYRFEPTETVVGPANAATPVTFENTRTAAPDEGQIADGGEPTVKVASFNVLNYFTTLGDQNDDNVGDGGCTAFRDRDDDGNSVNSGCDQRGAWDPQDLGRQQEKIVSAINALDADVVGLMEIENSAALGESADEATQTLVTALNADAGAGTWAANPSSAELPPAEDMDVITNAIIYKPAAVTRLGDARALGDQSEGSDPPAPTDEPFANAREPIAQAFTPTGDGTPFLVVVNHFKSKGSAGPFPGDTDQGDGQGAGNVSRVKQATALAEWLPTVQGDVDDVLLLGDFNSYTEEDPLYVLYDAGYVDLEEVSGNEEYSYSFAGLSGSLDHVLANESAVERFTGADVWNINGVEPLPMEYSRFNYHATNFHQPGPYRSSDHDPVIVGLREKPAEVAETTTALTVAPMNYGTPGTANIQVTSTNPLSGTVELREGTTVIGTAQVAANGTATISIPGNALSVGSHTLTAYYSGDATNTPSQGSAQVQVSKAVSTTTLDVDPSEAVVRQDRITLTATVSATGVTPTGQVVFSANGVEIGTATVTGGIARLRVGPASTVGTLNITAAYQGDATAAPSTSDPEQLKIVKADVRLKADVKPDKVIVNKTKTRVMIEVSAHGQKVTGKVEVTWSGHSRTVTLRNGKATVELGKWGSTGHKWVKVRYLGSDLANPATEVVTFQVRSR